MRTRFCLVTLLCSTPFAVTAQETPEGTCGKVLEYFNAGDLDGALEEARWCVEALEQIKQSRELDFFKEQVAGWSRINLAQNKAMGFTMTEALYNKGGKNLEVSLTGGAGGANALGNFFGAFAQAGVAAGAGNRLRIQGRTAVTSAESGTNQVMVTLESGGFIELSSRNATVEEIVEFAQQFPIRELDEARR